MRSQAAIRKKRFNRAEEEKEARESAAELPKSDLSVRQIAERCGLSITTAQRIRKAVKESDNAPLETLLDPVTHHAGRPTVLEPAEDELIVDKAYEAARRGFALDNNIMKSIQAKIADDGRLGFTNGVPSDAALRSFRARNRSITLRGAENIVGARLAAENYEHVQSLKTVLKEVQEKHPSIFSDPRRVWNWDETSAAAEYGTKLRCYAPASGNQGGARRAAKDHGRHVTAGIAVSAVGDIAPLFLAVAGKKMSHWLEPLNAQDFRTNIGVPHWLTTAEWFPNNTTLSVTPNGSMDQHTISEVVRHINDHVRLSLPETETILLMMDGHSSRNGLAWLERCQECNIEVVKLPANTSHFLQSCDKSVNKTFQQTVRKTRDELLSMCHISHANVAFKMKLAVAGHRALTSEISKNLSRRLGCGLWTSDFCARSWIAHPSQASHIA